MSPIWIAVIVFVVVVIVLGVVWRGNTLDKLEPLPGEELRFEEWGVRVKQVGHRPTLHLNCCVRVTNRRLIIGAKMLFSKQHALLHSFELDGGPTGMDIGETLKSGYVRGGVPRSSIQLGQEREQRYVEVPMHWLQRRLQLYCKEPDRCHAALLAQP